MKSHTIVANGARDPKDLEGERVGVNRGYTVTTGVWARGVLEEEHGVDLGKVTWVLSGDEHVAEYRPPSNVVPLEPGRELADLLAAGELAAAIGVDGFEPLIPDCVCVPFNDLAALEKVLATRRIEDGQQVDVVARVALGGTPTASSGDPFGQVSYHVGKDGKLNIVIDRLAP